MSTLTIKNLHVSIEDKKILKGFDLTINTGEIHAIMGPNGTGKSTLAAAIMGHPAFEITDGEIWLDDLNILELEVDERARAGLFLAVQYPSEIPGITNAEFLRAAMNASRDEDDKVNSPSHYTRGDIEVIDIIKQLTQGYDPFEAYLVGNTIKYLARANYKENKQQDLEKAQWHINKLLEEEE